MIPSRDFPATRGDLLDMLNALAEPYAGELTNLNIQARKAWQTLRRKWGISDG